MILGTRIKERRQALSITQRDLAQAIQTTMQHVSAIEQNKRIPSLPILVKLSAQLKVSLDYLVLGKETSSDVITAIKNDPDLDAGMKKSLINLVKVMREAGKKQEELPD